MVLERFFVDTVMIKMRGVIEKKLGAAGGPAHNVDPYPEANRFLNLCTSRRLCLDLSSCPYIFSIVSTSYLLEISDWRSNFTDGEDGSGSKRVYFLREGLCRTGNITSRSFYKPDRESSSFPLDGGPITLLRGQLNRGLDLAAKSL